MQQINDDDVVFDNEINDDDDYAPDIQVYLIDDDDEREKNDTLDEMYVIIDYVLEEVEIEYKVV